MPFILRGVSLLGVNSTDAPSAELRGRCGSAWPPICARPCSKEMARTMPFAELPKVFDDFMNASVSRRIVVDMNAVQ